MPNGLFALQGGSANDYLSHTQMSRPYLFHQFTLIFVWLILFQYD